MVKGGERMAEVLKRINEIAWGMPLVILVVGAGILFFNPYEISAVSLYERDGQNHGIR